MYKLSSNVIKYDGKILSIAGQTDIKIKYTAVYLSISFGKKHHPFKRKKSVFLATNIVLIMLVNFCLVKKDI